jgi:TRAP-type transport system periplasmic protein
MMRLSTGLVALVAGVAVAAAATGATAQTTRWIAATGFAESNFHTQNARSFADDVKARTGGRLEIVVHSGGSLVRLPEILRAVQTGQVQAGEMLMFIYGNLDPLFELDTIPFVAVGYDAARRLYELQKPHLDRRFADRGIKPLYYVPWPGQGIVAQKRVQTIDDLRGSKMRTVGQVTARFAELIGAAPTIVQTAEIAQAFFTGLVDSSIYSPTTGVDTQAWDYAKVFVNAQAMHSKNAFSVNRRAFDALPADLQRAVLDAAAAAEKRGWEMSQRRQDEALAELRHRGMDVVDPNPALMAQLKDIGGKMLDEWMRRAGPDGEAIVRQLHK